jgi:hypothetical protein
MNGESPFDRWLGVAMWILVVAFAAAIVYGVIVEIPDVQVDDGRTP